MFDSIDPAEVVMVFFAVVLGGPAALDRLERVGMLPGRIGAWWLHRAQRTVAGHERGEALNQIAEHVTTILKMVQTDSGTSLYDIATDGRDTARRTEQKLEAHITKCDNDHEVLFDNMETALGNERGIARRLSEIETRMGQAS